jgi:hypothetical protein
MKAIKIFLILLILQVFTNHDKNLFAQWTLELETDSSFFLPGYFTYINVIDSSTVFALGDYNQIWRRSSDNNWVNFSTQVSSIGYSLCIAGKSIEDIWLTSFYDTNFTSSIYRSSNAGLNWVQQVNSGIFTFNGIQFSRIHPSYGYAWATVSYVGGYPSKIYKTRDAGNSWIEYQVDIPDEYYGYRPSICITDSNHAWFNLYKDGDYDTVRVLYTTNGGNSFQISKLPLVGFTASALEFKDDNLTGIAVIDLHTSYILRTVNGGLSWSISYIPNLLGHISKLIWIPNSTTWYAAVSWTPSTSNPKIYKSTNDGFSWFPMSFPDNFVTLVYMDGVAYGSKVYLYAIGNGNTGKVYRLSETVNTVSVQNQNTIVNDFNLYQNYPNPFNPATKIKFDIPKSSFVNLKIFDITGREVMNLVNQNLNAGSYEAVWNAEGFSSGIYFYTLKADNFYLTRRMIFLK